MAGDATWTMGKSIGVIVVFVVIVTAIGFMTRGFGLISEKVFAPAQEQVRHDVFKESQSYRDGMANELDKMYLEYQKADEAGKAALRSVALHKVASFDVGKLPAHLQAFVNDLRQAR